MFLVLYDIKENKLRTQFSKTLQKYGRRIQYSVFEIKNSERYLSSIKTILEVKFAKYFSQSDSVMIIKVPDNSIIERFGYAKNEDEDLLFF